VKYYKPAKPRMFGYVANVLAPIDRYPAAGRLRVMDQPFQPRVEQYGIGLFKSKKVIFLCQIARVLSRH